MLAELAALRARVAALEAALPAAQLAPKQVIAFPGAAFDRQEADLPALTYQLVRERQRAYGYLRRQFDFTRAITDSLGEGVCAVDHEGRLTFMNPAAIHLLGWSSAELLGKGMHEKVHFQRADGTPLPVEECMLHTVLRTATTVRSDADMFTRKDGSVFPIVYVVSPIISDGHVVGGVVAFHDITERKQLEDELRRSERAAARQAQELEAIFEAMTDAVVVYDAQGDILKANTAARGRFVDATEPKRTMIERLARFDARDALGNVLSSAQWAQTRALRGETLTGASAQEVFLRALDGSEMLVNVCAAPIYDLSRTITGAVVIVRQVAAER